MPVYVESGPRGRLQFVRGGSQRSQRNSDGELLNQAEETISDLNTRVSYAEEQLWRLQNVEADFQAFRNAHRNCGDLRVAIEMRDAELTALERDLADERERAERYRERLRLVRRQSGSRERYRERLDVANREIQDLSVRLTRKDEDLVRINGLALRRDDMIRLQERRLAERDARIEFLSARLRRFGYVGD
ncbi:hypothetical protein B7494_g6537 [Chlorociboria aeruginascens]|nr:hypothetical protein B7494_g6537 [Chlorociboria aeruginascens]